MSSCIICSSVFRPTIFGSDFFVLYLIFNLTIIFYYNFFQAWHWIKQFTWRYKQMRCLLIFTCFVLANNASKSYQLFWKADTKRWIGTAVDFTVPRLFSVPISKVSAPRQVLLHLLKLTSWSSLRKNHPRLFVRCCNEPSTLPALH